MKNSLTKILKYSKKKKHQLKRRHIDRPAAWGGVTCSHSKAVHAFSVERKIFRAKAHHTGEKLIKPAAVEMARILCGDAVLLLTS